MIKTFHILSTKTLDFNQSQAFFKSIHVVSQDFISICPESFNIPIEETELTIFSSQNAVRAVAQKISIIENDIVCVGQKTAELIQQKFMKWPTIVASSSKELGEAITASSYQSATFYHGNLRREELLSILDSHQIHLEEVTVYKTELTPHTITSLFDGILFFSPSGVESYLKNNLFSKNTTIFAIGNTTAHYIKKHGKACVVAEKPTIESLIQTVNQYFLNKK